MIAISSKDGSLLKVLSAPQPGSKDNVVGFHPAFGFVTASTFKERLQNRVRHGYREPQTKLDFKFNINLPASGAWVLSGVDGCEVLPEDKGWKLNTPRGQFIIQNLAEEAKAPEVQLTAYEKQKDNIFSILLLLMMALPLLYLLVPDKKAEEAPVIQETVTVKMPPETQKPVTVPSSLAKVPENLKQNAQFKRAIKQDLGFMGLLGRKDLTKALGGAPTQLKDASPGAGPGGKEGSGGELLVGLGQGLKRTTVGNSGVAGLGGIGTKGAGGGQGGYGNSQIGSGEGRGLSSIPLAQDVVLEGGLDQSVVQATIAKYLSQVRACYEQGLKNNPGLGGLVTMNFEINSTGNLNFAKVGKSTLGDPQVESCISAKMMSWKFPNPRGGVNVKVGYPFLLRSARS